MKKIIYGIIGIVVGGVIGSIFGGVGTFIGSIIGLLMGIGAASPKDGSSSSYESMSFDCSNCGNFIVKSKSDVQKLKQLDAFWCEKCGSKNLTKRP